MSAAHARHLCNGAVEKRRIEIQASLAIRGFFIRGFRLFAVFGLRPSPCIRGLMTRLFAVLTHTVWECSHYRAEIFAKFLFRIFKGTEKLKESPTRALDLLIFTP